MHFFGFLEKATAAKWRYLGVVYGYRLATRMTLIYPEVEGWPLGISLGIPSHPPGLSTTMEFGIKTLCQDAFFFGNIPL